MLGRVALVGLVACACTASGPAPDAGVPASEADVPAIDPAPVRAVLLSTRMGKPPLRFYSVRLTLENRHERSMWLLLPSYISDTLPAAPVFSAEGAQVVPFGGKGYVGDSGEVVEVVMYANTGFSAFHLPPGGHVVLDGYVLEAWKAVERFEAWEVAELWVNRVLPLERWLPYPSMSSADGVVPREAIDDWRNLDWDPARSRGRADYPAEPVQEVTAELVRRWQVPLEDAAAP